MFTAPHPVIWIGLISVILVFLTIDLSIANRRIHKRGMREALLWTATWVSLAVSFGVLVYVFLGSRPALDYSTGYLLELSLSIDNLFVFAVIFAALGVPEELRHRVLFWGIIGALIMRGLFILSGSALLERFHWSIYLFGGLLLFASLRMVRDNGTAHPGGVRALVLLSRVVPMSPHFHGSAFFTRVNGRRVATALFAAVVLVELSDVMFAIDSVPAILSVTRDPFLVFASNAFAILGLRSMYALLSGVMDRFHYLKFGLAAILAFVGLKLITSEFIALPVWTSLLVIFLSLGAAILASLLWLPEAEAKPEPGT